MRGRALVSWSGGKDCCLAAHRARSQHELVGLVSMLTDDGSRSRSHGLRPEILHAQANAFGLPLLTANASWESYEQAFTSLLASAARQYGATHAVFGDIFPDAHKEWAERVSNGAGLIAVEPLWAEPTSDLVQDFITLGGKAIIVTVRDTSLDQTWLGRHIDRDTVQALVARGIDPCGEYGEYHSLVTYFPGYTHEITPSTVGIAQHGGCSLLDLTINTAP
jgi:diphthine-ammonia ligase